MSDAEQDQQANDDDMQDNSGATSMSAADCLVIRNQRKAIATHVEATVKAAVNKQLEDALAVFSKKLEAQDERVAEYAASQAEHRQNMEATSAGTAETLTLLLNAVSGMLPNPSGPVADATAPATTDASHSSQLTSADVAAVDGVTTSKAVSEELTYAVATSARVAPTKAVK
jgi:hypothetical protein